MLADPSGHLDAGDEQNGMVSPAAWP